MQSGHISFFPDLSENTGTVGVASVPCFGEMRNTTKDMQISQDYNFDF